MDSSGDSDCEESGIEYLASLMIETSTELIKIIRDITKDTAKEVRELVVKGNVARSNLEKLKHSSVNTKKSEVDNLELTFAAFVDHYEAWARKNGRLRDDRRTITEYRLTGAELVRKLSEVIKSKKMATDDEENSDTTQRDVNKFRKIVTDDKDHSKAGPQTPTNKNLMSTKVRFAQLSPKLDLLQTYQCHLCPRKYDWVKSLNRHLKNAHNGAEAEGNLEEVPDYVTCRMCKKRQRRENIRRHLTDIHGVEKQGPAAIFRGFVTIDEESWQPLFLEKGEKDPNAESTLMVPVHDGIITVFGIDFKVHDTMSPLSQGSRSSSSPISVGDTLLSVTKIVEKYNESLNSSSRPEAMKEDEEKSPIKESSMGDYCEKRVKRKLWVDDEFDSTDFANQSQEVDTENLENSLEPGKEISRVDVANGELWAASDDKIESDEFETDNFLDGDTIDDCEFRKEMRQMRLKRRDNVEIMPKLTEVVTNAKFISKFETYLAHSKQGSCKEPTDLSSYKKDIGHLFKYDDSFLTFMTKMFGPDYNLSRHLNPNSEDFMELPDPTGVGQWISSIAGESGRELPSRRKEMLKSHARLRDFIIDELENSEYGSCAESYIKKEAVLKRIKNISKKISEKNLFGKLKKLEEQVKARKLEARELLYPSNNFNEQQAAKKWLLSDVCKAEENLCNDIFNKCTVQGKKCTEKELVKLGNFARFQLALRDRNRKSVYSFSNKDFTGRRPKWLPLAQKEDVCIVDRFDLLPETWNADEPTIPGLKPSCWVIRLYGDTQGLKGGKTTDIIMTSETLSWCRKYQDVKETMVADIQDDDAFFVNAKNKPLTNLQRTPGSLLYKYMEVTGVQNPTINTFRRAMEPIIQASPMKQVVENIASHSATVGKTYYDRSGQNNRAKFVSTLAELESPQKEVDEVPEHVKEKRKEKDRAAKVKALERAKALLEDDKMKKSKNMKCKVSSLDRGILQDIISRKVLKSNEVFPDDTDWVQCFYRAVDSLPGNDGDNIRGIEERVFKEQVREEVIKELGPWKGSTQQNQLADIKTAVLIKSSLKVYEKSREKFQKSFFKF